MPKVFFFLHDKIKWTKFVVWHFKIGRAHRCRIHDSQSTYYKVNRTFHESQAGVFEQLIKYCVPEQQANKQPSHANIGDSAQKRSKKNLNEFERYVFLFGFVQVYDAIYLILAVAVNPIEMPEHERWTPTRNKKKYAEFYWCWARSVCHISHSESSLWQFSRTESETESKTTRKWKRFLNYAPQRVIKISLFKFHIIQYKYNY